MVLSARANHVAFATAHSASEMLWPFCTHQAFEKLRKGLVPKRRVTESLEQP